MATISIIALILFSVVTAKEFSIPVGIGTFFFTPLVVWGTINLFKILGLLIQIWT